MPLDYEKIKNISKDINRIAREENDKSLKLKKDILSILQPIMAQMVNLAKINKQEMMDIAKSIKVEVPAVTVNPKADVQVPEIKLPQINVPEPRVTVNVPKIDAPEVIMPSRMNIMGEVSISGVDEKRGLPVKLLDKYGQDVDLVSAMSQMVNGISTGGKSDFFTIRDIQTSSGASLINQTEGALKITGDLSASLSLDYGSGEIGSNTARFVQATDAIASVNVVDAFGSTAVDSVFNADNRLRVSVETGGSGLTDAELRASSVPVAQASGAVYSTYLTGANGSIAVYNIDGDGNYRDVIPVDATGSGDVPITLDGETVTVSGSLTSVGAYLLDGDGNYRDQISIAIDTDNVGLATSANQLPDGHNVTIDNASGGSAVNIQDGGNSITVDGTVAVSGVTGTIGANIVDSSGVAYSSSNPVPIDDAGGSITIDNSNLSAIQTSVQILDDWDAVHDSAAGSDGVLVMGEARTSNPTAVGNGDATRLRTDDLGRQLVRPFQVRDLTTTAYVSLTDSSEDTLLSGSASTFHDLVYVMGANESDAAVSVDFRCGTGGSVILSLEIPANSTAGVAPAMPIPMPEVAQAWTAQNPGSDISNTTINITALFTKEV